MQVDRRGWHPALSTDATRWQHMKRGKRSNDGGERDDPENDGENEQKAPMSTVRWNNSGFLNDNRCRRRASSKIICEDRQPIRRFCPHHRRGIIQ